eukprot:3941961-Rhodomonas_salina.12
MGVPNMVVQDENGNDTGRSKKVLPLRIVLCVCYLMSGASSRYKSLPAYARAAQCPVLTWRMGLPEGLLGLLMKTLRQIEVRYATLAMKCPVLKHRTVVRALSSLVPE